MTEKSIRVLQVFGILNRGGAETMIMNLYRAIDREKVQFDFVVHTDTPGAYDGEVESAGGRIFHAPRYRGINHFEYTMWWKHFLSLHPEFKIIHSHIRSTASIILRIAKQHGRVTIAHSHSTSNGRGLDAAVKGILQMNITRYADYLFACSDTAGQWLFGKRAIEGKNYHILRNAINVQTFSFEEEARTQIRKEFDLDDFFVMGTVGRITAPKNPFGMVKIIRSTCEKLPDARFLWVGAGDLEREVRQEIQSSGLKEKVVFAGVRADIPALLSAMDVFVLPSLWEGLPVSVIEAQASGLPCLLSSAITQEVCISPVVSQISVDNLDQWEMKILEVYEKHSRVDTKNYIQKAGYDIETTANWLQTFYLEEKRSNS